MKKFGEGQQPFHAIIDIPEGDSQELTTVTDQVLNSLYGELFNLLASHGIKPTATTSADLKQVSRAVWAAVNASSTFTDAGTANVKLLTHIKKSNFLFKNGTSGDDGFIVEFSNKAQNTDAVKISVYDAERDVNHFDLVSLVNTDGSELKAGALPIGATVRARYSVSDNKFYIVYVGNFSDLQKDEDGKGDALVAVKQPYAGAVKRTQHDKNLDFVSVKDFGAVGDGITDDSAAINNALKSGAGVILFPKAIYYITEPIDVQSNTILWGCKSTIKFKSQACTLNIKDAQSVIIDGLAIDGNYLAHTGLGLSGLSIYGSKDVIIKNCEIYNTINCAVFVAPNYETMVMSERIIVDNCNIYNAGTEQQASYFAYGNGVAVVGAKDILITNNFIRNVYGVGAINLEGLLQDNIIISGNRIDKTTGAAAGIKMYASGVDVEPNKVIIRDNILTNLSFDDKTGAEPAIWIEYGGCDISIINNIIDNANADGIFVSRAVNITIADNVIRNSPKASYTINTAHDAIRFVGNYIIYPSNAIEKPIWIESSGSTTSIAIVERNTTINAKGAAFMLVARSPIKLTDNTIVNCRSGTNKGHGVTHVVADLSQCVIGGNIIKDTLGNPSDRFVAFYDFSGNHADLQYIDDKWLLSSNIQKFDIYANTAFIRSDVPILRQPPSIGYNTVGRIVYNADIASTPVVGWVCVEAGDAGVWQPFGNLGIQTVDTATLTLVSSDINIKYKHQGKQVINTTDNKIYYAAGKDKASPWYSVDGVKIINPA